jgi:hypothetical protein
MLNYFYTFYFLKKFMVFGHVLMKNVIINLSTFQQKFQNNIYVFWNAKWKRYVYTYEGR